MIMHTSIGYIYDSSLLLPHTSDYHFPLSLLLDTHDSHHYHYDQQCDDGQEDCYDCSHWTSVTGGISSSLTCCFNFRRVSGGYSGR